MKIILAFQHRTSWGEEKQHFFIENIVHAWNFFRHNLKHQSSSVERKINLHIYWGIPSKNYKYIHYYTQAHASARFNTL